MDNSPNQSDKSDHWQHKILEKVALEGLKEQKRSRRWGIFFKFIFIVYLVVFTLTFFSNKETSEHYDALGKSTSFNPKQDKHIAMLSLSGVIDGKDGIDAFKFNQDLTRVLENDNVDALIIRANSPGGSPVQSALINKKIELLKTTTNKPVYVVISDVCASGCYYVAAAADKIIANPSSIVGSIGVISQSFGYKEAAKKLGIEPRTFTAGKYKNLLDPARDLTEKDKAVIKSILDDLHNNFIHAVKAGRKDKLSNDPDLFSGLFWTGNQSLVLGLIDEIGSIQTVVNHLGKKPVYNYDYQTPLESLLDQLGVSLNQTIQSVLKQGLSANNQWIIE